MQERYQHSSLLTRHAGRIAFNGNAQSKGYVRSDKSADTTVPVSAYRGVQRFDEPATRPKDKTYEQSDHRRGIKPETAMAVASGTTLSHMSMPVLQ